MVELVPLPEGVVPVPELEGVLELEGVPELEGVAVDAAVVDVAVADLVEVEETPGDATGGVIVTPADLQSPLAASRAFCCELTSHDFKMHSLELVTNCWLEQAHLKSVTEHLVLLRPLVKQGRAQGGKLLSP